MPRSCQNDMTKGWCRSHARLQYTLCPTVERQVLTTFHTAKRRAHPSRRARRTDRGTGRRFQGGWAHLTGTSHATRRASTNPSACTTVGWRGGYILSEAPRGHTNSAVFSPKSFVLRPCPALQRYISRVGGDRLGVAGRGPGCSNQAGRLRWCSTIVGPARPFVVMTRMQGRTGPDHLCPHARQRTAGAGEQRVS
jgi:hypothetical protein